MKDFVYVCNNLDIGRTIKHLKMNAQTLIDRIERCKLRNAKHQLNIRSNIQKIEKATKLLKELYNIEYED